MKISEQQIAAILALPGPQRYSHFIKRVVDQECAWGLSQDGWALLETNEGKRVFPLWPAEPYAVRCAIDEWRGYLPKRIPLNDLLDTLLPSLRASGTAVGVFFVPGSKQGVLPTWEQFDADLRTELKNY